MKIAYIDPYPVPDYRVASLQILQNVDAFARQGHHVCLITPKGQSLVEEIMGRSLPPSAEQITLHDIRRKWYFPLNTQKLFYFQVSRWLKEHPVDAIFTRNIKMANYLLCKHPEIPHFFESHEVFSQSFKESHDLVKHKNQHKYQKLRKIEQQVYERSQVVFVLTSLLGEDIYKEYGVKTPIVIAPDGVDMLAVNATNLTPSGKEYKDGLPTQVLYLGSLHRWKGIPTVMKAMSFLDNAMLNIAGGTPEQITRLRQTAKQIGVADRVNFLGFVQPKHRFQVIADHDICVLPLTKTSIGSRYTSPLKLFEYMAMGKPVVISDFPSIRDAVDEKAVNFANSENAESFAEQIQWLINHPAEVMKKVDYARQLVAERFNWDQRAKLITNVIAEKLSE
ncbi:glycosyltransferase [Xenorhabdus nematophila]|uniref:glycosyltransferase n=1 Tax=Xenorhabdus nematophila TaxID=628 RepID=UPI0003275A4E|nr:glycosyltransferase [Xenorhabdus nematophila]CEF32947.1 WalM protein [Xenorhabdus nematophila str. Websteri]AYA41537.1 glycosyltransferase family 1 protein [Xenorhabdus nematophila]MBA0020276.1 glycosyltransferase [Xenorhabdus nematophila]MCB4425466.1 glycosyltransferase [Xenorhabdus nematophila]QNJ35925.1 glycosyltransferase [Xenorhabdus nematophila]